MNANTNDDIGKLVLRVVLGILLLVHGVTKLTHGVGPISGVIQEIGLPSYVVYGVFLGEVLGPILVVIGWYARIGAALIVVNMIFAIGLAHRGELLALDPRGGWALELEAMYLCGALALAFIGPGRFSVNGR
jgi:putative oxidoreductase